MRPDWNFNIETQESSELILLKKAPCPRLKMSSVIKLIAHRSYKKLGV